MRDWRQVGRIVTWEVVCFGVGGLDDSDGAVAFDGVLADPGVQGGNLLVAEAGVGLGDRDEVIAITDGERVVGDLAERHSRHVDAARRCHRADGERLSGCQAVAGRVVAY